ncbi:MAG: DUF4347 domain-containing protein [Symplocastrum torsivum CPER-KK1]|jgi:hypothetical protein|uniref:DUF4347 domain-containing protein n=1 Tax=Symplocastrum torsivum CPER-KK1 TaxID=450513 RepID=A0A951UBJ3_9CYAN|nr:DUF4347 domain-containing protein [Symplocastrum torsivum CPER-KK1]
MKSTKHSTSKTSNQVATVVFVDAGVENYQQLVNGVISPAEVFVLEAAADGIEQISQVLQQRQDVGAVHIISHGAPGCLYLGNTQLSLDTFNRYATQLQQWDVANLLLYGCNVAAGDAGAEFIAKLHTLTGAEIAASKTLTGSAAKGGNWELEVTTAKAVATLAFEPVTLENYPAILGTLTGAGATWTYYDNGSGIEEATLGGQDDAFDDALRIEIDGEAFAPPTDGTATGQTFTSSTVVMSGLNVTAQYYADPNQPVLRQFVSLENPTDNPITITYRLSSNVGSDGETTVQATSSGDTSFTTSDRWVITDDSPTGADPTNTFVLSLPNGLAPNFVSQTDPSDDILAEFTVTIPANSTRSLLFFNALSDTSATAQANVSIFDDMAALQASTLLDGLTSEQLANTLNLMSAPANNAPTIANEIANQSATQDSAFNFTVPANTFNDVDAGDTLTYTATLETGEALPSWLSFDAATGTFSGTPSTSDVGILGVTLTATDSFGASISDTFNLAIADANQPPNNAPIVANEIADQSATQDSAFNFTVPGDTFNDVDAEDTLTYTATLETGEALPSWLSFDAATGTFSGTPSTSDVGIFGVTLTATDSFGASISDTFNLAIADSNGDPNPEPTQTNSWDFVSIDYNLDGATDIMALNRSGTASGKTEVHIMDAATGYQSWALQTSTILHETDDTWDFGHGDCNGDGASDIVSIKKSGTESGTTEIHIMDAATGYQSWVFQTSTILHETGDNFEFQTGDYNGDGYTDIFAIKKSETGTNSTEFHVLDGATNYQSCLLQTGTALHETGNNWDFQVGDYNGDGLMDILGVKQSATDSNSTEIHILDGASNYQAFSLQTSTVLGMTEDNWSFAMGNNNLISLNQGNTGTGTTEVHILEASTNYQSWLIQTGTVLHETAISAVV